MNRIFTWARVKLTAIYLVIIMIVSLLFSAVIYNGVSRELRARFVAIEQRFEGRDIAKQMRLHEVLLDDLKNAERSLFFILIYADSLIFAAAGIAGFVMAGKTLEPIEEAMEEQKRFIADASHELKTPLTAIKTSIEVTLRDKKLTLKQAKKVLSQSLEEVDKMKDLSSGLLTMAKLTQYQEVAKKDTNLKAIAEAVFKNMKPLADDKKIKFNKKLGKVHAQVDPDSIEKLFRILVDNAIKYTNKGKIFIELKKVKRETHFIVKDTGIGIAQKDKQNIFDRFYRADTSRSKSYTSGFGLGLSLAKQIAEAHGGCIELKSVVNKGSTFTVKLPA